MDNQRGLSLLDLIVFIVIMGILVSGMLVAINKSQTMAVLPKKTVQATFLASARMDVILLNRAVNGFAGLSDPCAGGSPPAICTPLLTFASANGLTVVSTLTTVAPNTTIDVDVSGAGQAKVTAIVSDY